MPDRLRGEVAKRRSKRRRIVFSVITVAVLLLVAVAAAGALWLADLSREITITDAEGNVVEVELEERLAEEPYTVLILGYDKDEWGTSRSDTIMLARVDEQAGKVWLLSIPRDVKVQLAQYGTEKINAAFALGGPELAIRTVEDLIGIPINHYIGIEMLGFVDLIEAMGGIEIDVPMYIEPGGETWEQPIEPGLQVLDGWQSLWFVRARYQFEQQDIARTENQQYFLKAVADQASNTPITKLVGVVNAVSSMIQTDMGLPELARMAKALRDVGSDNMYTATIPTIWKEPYLELVEPDFSELIQKFKNGEPMGIDPEEMEDEDLGSEGTTEGATNVTPAQVSLTIRNGSDRNGLAAQASTLLQSAGFTVNEIGNVQNPGSYNKTYVVYKENRAHGQLVARHLQPGVEVRASGGTYVFEGDVLIVIGSDWDLEKVPLSQSQ